jgi:phosphohistidine phosphatase SixA
MTLSRHFFIALAALPLFALSAPAQNLEGDALVQALRHGGYVILMRHASSPREAPSKAASNADNVNLERQLDETGRATATAMGEALRKLKIPIGEVVSSPTYRALETVRYARFGSPKTAPELGDNGQSMQVSTEAQTAWLQKRVTQFPPPGANTLLITHFPNISRAFPQESKDVADGECLIFGPDGKGGAALVARVKIEQWPSLR